MAETHAHRQRPRVSQLERNGTLLFLAVAFIVAGLVAWIAFSRTVITVELGSHLIHQTTTVTVRHQPEPTPPGEERNATTVEDGRPLSGEIGGLIEFATVRASQEVEVQGDGQRVDDYARGTITIINRWTKAQPLAATTRLKAESNGMIYRTTRRVDVPAGGQIDVEAVADEIGERGNVAPTKFTIVALWPGLQSDIFGQNELTFTGGTRSEQAVTQVAIDEAMNALRATLATDAKMDEGINVEAVGDFSSNANPIVVAESFTASAKPGERVSRFTVDGESTLARIFLPVSIRDQADASLNALLPPGEHFLGETSIAQRVLSVDAQQRRALVELTIERPAALFRQSPALDPAAYTRKTKAEVLSVLRGTPGIRSAEMTIAPFWASRTPGRSSQITVNID